MIAFWAALAMGKATMSSSLNRDAILIRHVADNEVKREFDAMIVLVKPSNTLASA